MSTQQTDVHSLISLNLSQSLAGISFGSAMEKLQVH